MYRTLYDKLWACIKDGVIFCMARMANIAQQLVALHAWQT